MALGASAVLLLGCARRTPSESEPRGVPAVRQLASPGAFDLVPTSSGAALVWASSSPGALHLEGFDAAGHPSSESAVVLDTVSAVAEVAAQESSHPRLTGQLGHIGVEIKPVDACEFQDDVILLELGDGRRHSHGGVGWAFVPSV